MLKQKKVDGKKLIFDIGGERPQPCSLPHHICTIVIEV